MKSLFGRYIWFFVVVCFIHLSLLETANAQSLKNYFKKSELNKWSSCGILVYDIDRQDTILKYQSDKYFVPASNTKILTFYAALQHLPDTLAAFKYQIQNDTLYIWGVGNPTLWNPTMEQHNDAALEMLKNTDKKIVLCYNRYLGNAYGKGWMWDDYTDMYQPEINEFPVYGNLIEINTQKKEKNIYPDLKEEIQYKWSDTLLRQAHQNIFELPENKNTQSYATYLISAKTASKALSSLLGKEIILNIQKPLPLDAKIAYSSITRDSVLKFMMQESDNFTAEQLHLMLCDQLQLSMKVENSIDYLKKNSFHFYSPNFEWVDGSGLSRYNLLSPELLVSTLNQIYKQKQDNVFQLLTIGGKVGTLKKLFTISKQPYVYGKTGTLTGVACISGYLITKSGKTLTFCIMANNHLQKAKQIREQIELLIDRIYNRY